jgi:hypothetical protein
LTPAHPSGGLVQRRHLVTELPGPRSRGYLLEIAGVVAAALLLTRLARSGWLLSLGVAAGPILGYVLSRGPGLPDYTDDIGNWTEPLGIISLLVEGTLLILAATSLRTSHHRCSWVVVDRGH